MGRMTQDEKLKALIEAGKALDTELALASCGKLNTHVEAWGTFQKALAAFKPEPEFEYVLDEKAPLAFHGFAQSCAHYWANFSTQTPSESAMQGLWNNLRELTRVPKKPKGREFYVWDQTAHPDPKSADLWGRGYDKTDRKILRVREVMDDTP